MTQIFQRLDPRTRVLTTVCAVIIVASTPKGILGPFSAYAALCIVLLLTDRVSVRYIAQRCLVASPFILLASGLLMVQNGFSREAVAASAPAALSVAAKGYASVFLFSFLTGSTALSDLLAALRRLGSPHSLNLILSMMYRYTSLLTEEYSRMERARECRTVRPLGKQAFGVFSRQLGELFLRSWDRAERVHAAMLARGFDGVWPVSEQPRLSGLDFGFFFLACGLFLAARLTL